MIQSSTHEIKRGDSTFLPQKKEYAGFNLTVDHGKEYFLIYCAKEM